MRTHWLDRLTGPVAPRWTLKRQRARLASDLLLRNYEGASVGRRTQGWRRVSTDANQATSPFMGRLRDVARDLVRNNPNAAGALSTIADDIVDYGIRPTPAPNSKKARDLWRAWGETTACDADGRHDFYGLQKLVARTVIESGAALVRRRLRRPEDGLPLPIQLQVLEPDFIDLTKDNITTNNGGARIIQGIEYDALGRRIAYWLFKEHPGSSFAGGESVRVPAESMQHVFKVLRPGQVHGVTWFAPVLLKFKDFDDYDDATLMKQKIAACLAVIVTDVDGTASPLGSTDTSEDPQIDSLQPGAILNVPPGRTIETVQPPNVREYADYARTQLRAIAAGLEVNYEDLTGDYQNMPFSAARMARLKHQKRIDRWRWQMLIPQFCDPAWGWFAQAATISGTPITDVEWTAPPAPMIDPVNEGLAYMRNIRTGIMSLSEALRERGYNPEDVLKEIAADMKRLDALGIILDSDPRYMTQAGQLQGEALPDEPAAAPAAEPDAEPEPEPGARGLASGFEIQTTHGYYPIGTWGHASYHLTAEEAITSAREYRTGFNRVVDLATNAVIWPERASA